MAEPLPVRRSAPMAPSALHPIDPDEAALRDRLFRALAPVALPWSTLAGDTPVAWATTGEAPVAADAAVIALTLGEARAWLALPDALAAGLLAAVDPAAGPRADAIRPLLFELAFDAPIAAVEQATGQPVHIVDCVAHSAIPADCLRLGISLDHGDVRHRLVLALDRVAADAACRYLDGLPTARGRWHSLPVSLICRIGDAWLGRADLRSLQRGDVIVPAGSEPAPNRAMLVGPDGRHAATRRDGNRLTLLAGFSPPEATEDATMTDAAPPLDRLDELPIHLVFEAGRLEVPLGRLDALGTGQVLLLPGDPDAPIAIVANGRRIGTGTLVRVGERVGVQVAELDPHE